MKLSLLSRFRLLPRYIRDRTVSGWKKFLVLLGVIYILSPIDAIPEIFLPFIGWLDDVGLLTLLTVWMYGELGKWEAIQSSKVKMRL